VRTRANNNGWATVLMVTPVCSSSTARGPLGALEQAASASRSEAKARAELALRLDRGALLTTPIYNRPEDGKRSIGAHWRVQMKKLKHEAELFKAALLAGVQYAEGRKAVEFEANDSASDKALYVYRLLVHDKVISPMPENQVGEKTIRHRLATWYAHQLPQGHPLLE
jgi:hypothetical protein